jgi:SAM-dependent methyltransferase
VDHADHVALIRAGVAGLENGAWLELGSGGGAFTLALADLLDTGSSIVSVDREDGALREQGRRLAAAFPDARVARVRADFTDPTALADHPGPFDGMLMANALHFVDRRDQEALVGRLLARLRPGARFILVEYDADRGNAWVPHPISYARWERVASGSGLVATRMIGRLPSRFLGAIYSALSEKPGAPAGAATAPLDTA